MFRKDPNAGAFAVALIESGSACVAIARSGTAEVLAHAREDLPLEGREKSGLRSGVIQALATAGDKAVAAYAKSGASVKVGTCYCVIGAPWTRSFAGSAHTHLEQPSTISDNMIADLAKQALTDQKEIERAALLEANVSRVLLNGYPTSDPAGKRASEIDIFTLVSDCDAAIKASATETLGKLFPGAPIVWRSSTRAALVATKQIDPVATSLIVIMDGEATDLISVRKGVLDQRILVEQGFRQILGTLIKGKPVEETMSLLEMLEKDQSDTDAGEELRLAIAKAEPDLVHLFGEALAKISSSRKLTDDLVIIAPPAISPWLSRFFARIDFTQFTATTRPFSVKAFPIAELAGVPHNDPAIYADPDLCIALSIVNMEHSS
jgi:hypothetical protein